MRGVIAVIRVGPVLIGLSCTLQHESVQLSYSVTAIMV